MSARPLNEDHDQPPGPWSPAVQRIADLFARHGDRLYDGARRESVTALQHALQCAQLAELGGAGETLVAAALLHDVGHFVAEPVADDRVDDAHEAWAMPLLTPAFDRAVTEPIRLHVAAKRFLVATDRNYRSVLSPASISSLEAQGGPMNPQEVEAFASLEFARAAVLLRQWDDMAKDPARRTPPLAHFLRKLERLTPPL